MQNRNIVGLILTASILTGCTLPAQPPASEGNQQAIATVVAQTMQAVQTPLASPIASSASPIASPLASPSATTATPTSAADKAILSITGNSNCRSGPGGSFKNVTSFTPGAKLEIVGRNTDNNYWQVKIPSTEETCWVWGQYATASGNIDNLPEVAPVSSSGSAPNRPGSLFYSYSCSFGSLSTVLNWTDTADNETGYRVYRFDILLADLPANSTTYTDDEQVTPGSALQYSVEAYNDAGSSPRRTISFTCE